MHYYTQTVYLSETNRYTSPYEQDSNAVGTFSVGNKLFSNPIAEMESAS